MLSGFLNWSNRIIESNHGFLNNCHLLKCLNGLNNFLFPPWNMILFYSYHLASMSSTTGSQFRNPCKMAIDQIANPACGALKKNQPFKVASVSLANRSIPKIYSFTGAINAIQVNGVAFHIAKVTLAQRQGSHFLSLHRSVMWLLYYCYHCVI